MTLRSTTYKSETDFGRQIRGAVRGFWNGTIDYLGFVDIVLGAVHRGYEQAWREGSAVCGITPQERTMEESIVLDRQVLLAQSSVMGFADFVEAHRKVDGFLMRDSAYRASLWSNRYRAVVTLAQSTSCADRKFVWRLGPTSEHCSDCANYAGRVHRGSVWQSVGAIPQSRSLECHGFNCLCSLVPTNERATPGRPGRPHG